MAHSIELSERDRARFWSKVENAGEGECWRWTDALTTHGYGQLWLSGRYISAHRIAWTIAYGPIPDGLLIDHLCRNRACVNAAHLDLVTQRENVVRGDSAACVRTRRDAQTECLRGHEYTPENTRISRAGYRFCRACERMRAEQKMLTGSRRLPAVRKVRK